MISLGNILILVALAMSQMLAFIAIIRGYKGMKNIRRFENTDKKTKVFYKTISAIHMIAGILITISYCVIILIILSKL